MLTTHFKKITVISFSLFIMSANATPLDDLLEQVKKSNNVETSIDTEALIQFKNDLKNQQTNLKKQRDRNKALQQKMTRSQDNIALNNKKISELNKNSLILKKRI